MKLLLHSHGARRPAALAALLLAVAGCPTLDVEQPIALVPDSDWSDEDRDILASAADCWNKEFGTHLTVGASDTIMQQVRVRFSDFVCLYAAGRTEPTLPVSVDVCPVEYIFAVDCSSYNRKEQCQKEKNEEHLFSVLLHELGHVLNIRSHADKPGSVMSADFSQRSGGLIPRRFSEEDHRLFEESNEGVQLAPRCHAFLVNYYPQCLCGSW